MPAEPAELPRAQRARILRAAIGLGLYAGAFGTSFGAVSVGSGLSVPQTMLLSLVMFSGASQFAFVGVVAAGSPFAAIPAALLLGVRNAFYGVTLSEILNPRGWRRLWTAHFVIDETTAMAVGQSSRRAQRYAFWATGLILCACWQTGQPRRRVDRHRARSGRVRPRRGGTGGVPGAALAGPEAGRQPLGGAGRRRGGAGPGPDRPDPESR